MRLTRTIMLAAAATLALAACDSRRTRPTRPPARRQPRKPPATRRIATGIARRQQVRAAAKAAGLDATLAGPGPYTVLVPDDAAFDKMPAGALDTLMKPESRAELTGVLTYHILPGTILADDIGKAIDNGKGKAVLATMGGGTLTATREGDKIVLTDAAGGKARDRQGRRQALQRRRPPHRRAC